MENFKHDTYVVLDLPVGISEKIMNLRSQFKDEFRMSLPAEITIAGSSGNGVIQYDQDPTQVFLTLNEIASMTKPIKATFGDVMRFPKTDIFFFSLQDEVPLHNFHNQINESNIRFSTNQFPYKPHCTLCSRSSMTEGEITELLSLKLPQEFELDTMSVYSLEHSNENVIVHLLHRVKLTGGNQ
ncbi:2'-5' RNA ligase family protein [Paenibacillus sp. WQ 127069]|uniref:2'-5' RNA ligase family protein n=1 Tax=Paenibacillus baimaensis TaxID=2982185 RepID=A0ABT2UFK3_9BACL|nr:2'-5' RNA ligase family protein [Paenibacillus sp. WQ 127069]MCU6793387.1 2'-5' RNA ligase family protein [Paenibacillus sp. WQ 127069]